MFTNFCKAILPLTALLTLGLATARPATATYTVTDLGLGVPYGINDHGQVVGQKNLSGGTYHAFLYTGSLPLVDLGVLPSGTNSRAYAINNNTPYGVVAGVSDTTNPVIPPHGSPYTDNVSHATRFVYNGSTVTRTDLGTLVIPTQTWPPDISTSVAYAINDSGVIVGSAGTLPSNAIGRAFSWNGSMTNLSTLGGQDSWAYGINASGKIVGAAQQASSITHASAWPTTGGITDLGALGSPANNYDSDAEAINTSGQIVGSSYVTSTAIDGFLYTTGMSDIGSIAPEAINASNVIVGSASGHAVIRSGTTTTDLNTLITPGSGFTLTNATGINSSGWIICAGTDSSGNTHALLLK